MHLLRIDSLYFPLGCIVFPINCLVSTTWENTENAHHSILEYKVISLNVSFYPSNTQNLNL